MQVNPYLVFSGQCEEAFRFYEKAIGGKIEGILLGKDTPMCEELPKEMANQVMHACLLVGDTRLMGSDAPPEHFEKMQGLSVALHIEKPADAQRIFGALAEGGTVTMPLTQTFWAELFGTVTDRFGTPWMINCGGSVAAAGDCA
jgi:PhnB protein